MLLVTFFFFKQKTAYEIGSGLVGSEMCIRDSMYMHMYQAGRLPYQDVARDVHDRGYSTAGSVPVRAHD